MGITARYAHTNIVARDWRSLAKFYEQVFGCLPVPPERDFEGEQLELGTGVRGAHVRGLHLRLPGYGDNGPTLEIFTYQACEESGNPVANRLGFRHIAFSVDDVTSAQKAVMDSGGHAVGKIVTLRVGAAAKVTWCYVTDPEGNLIELQSWSNT